MKRLTAAPELGILLVLLLACGFFQAMNPAFLSPGNLAVMARSAAFTGILAVGMGYLLISGQIDISVGAIAGLASIVATFLMTKAGVSPWVGTIAGLCVGAAAGYINAKLVLKLGVSAVLSTISTLYIYRGLALVLSSGYTIYPLPQGLEDFGQATPLGISWAWWIFVGLVIAGELILRWTVWGLTVKATGSDRDTARNTEVDINKVNTQTFMLCGLCAAGAGILLTLRIMAGEPTLGTGWELNCITAAAIGGVSLFGYDGSMLGVFLGVLLIQVVQNGLVVIGASAYWQGVEIGILLIATAVYDLRRKANLELKRSS